MTRQSNGLVLRQGTHMGHGRWCTYKKEKLKPINNGVDCQNRFPVFPNIQRCDSTHYCVMYSMIHTMILKQPHIPDSCSVVQYFTQYSTVQYGTLHQLTNTKLTAYCMTASYERTYVAGWRSGLVYHCKLLIHQYFRILEHQYFRFVLHKHSSQYHAGTYSEWQLGSVALLYLTVVVLVCNTHQSMHSYRRCAGCH